MRVRYQDVKEAVQELNDISARMHFLLDAYGPFIVRVYKEKLFRLSHVPPIYKATFAIAGPPKPLAQQEAEKTANALAPEVRNGKKIEDAIEQAFYRGCSYARSNPRPGGEKNG